MSVYINPFPDFDSGLKLQLCIFIKSLVEFAFKLLLSLSVEIHSLMGAIRYLFVW